MFDQEKNMHKETLFHVTFLEYENSSQNIIIPRQECKLQNQ